MRKRDGRNFDSESSTATVVRKRDGGLENLDAAPSTATVVKKRNDEGEILDAAPSTTTTKSKTGPISILKITAQNGNKYNSGKKRKVTFNLSNMKKENHQWVTDTGLTIDTKPTS